MSRVVHRSPFIPQRGQPILTQQARRALVLAANILARTGNSIAVRKAAIKSAMSAVRTLQHANELEAVEVARQLKEFNQWADEAQQVVQ